MAGRNNRLLGNFCKDNISKSTYKIQCSGECVSWYHKDCSGLVESEFMKIVKEKKRWFCINCQTSKSEVKSTNSQVPNETKNDKYDEILKELRELKTHITQIKDIKDEIHELRNSLQFMSEQYEEQRNTSKTLLEMIKENKKENIELKREVSEMKDKMNILENEKRMSSIAVGVLAQTMAYQTKNYLEHLLVKQVM